MKTSRSESLSAAIDGLYGTRVPDSLLLDLEAIRSLDAILSPPPIQTDNSDIPAATEQHEAPIDANLAIGTLLSAWGTGKEVWEHHRLLGSDRNDGCVVSIPLPDVFGKRWPDAEIWNHSHKPHVTVLYVASEQLTAGLESVVMGCVRRACSRVVPFRLRLDVGRGLQDFGTNPEGQKALWFPVLCEPRGELERLHRAIDNELRGEGIEPQGHKDFVPHCTWCYVSGGITTEDRNRWDAGAAARLSEGVAWDVRNVMVSLAAGDRPVMLNPRAP